MPKFGDESQKKLDTLDTRLQWVMKASIIGGPDFSIVEGKRSVETQREYYRQGLTRTMNSKHVYPQQTKSLAVDVVPFVDGKQLWVQKPQGLTGLMWSVVRRYTKRWAQMAFLAGWIMAKADELGVPLRWGGDWDGDFDFSDNDFDDIWHFELRNTSGSEG